MRTSLRVFVGTLVVGLALATSPLHGQGRAVVSHDEWLTGNAKFGSVDDMKFVDNTLNWFGVTSGDKLLVYSANPFLTGSSLNTYLTVTRGLNVTYNAAESPANFSQYAAIFVGGNPGMNGSALATYVFGGGHVFLEGGTGTGGAAGEAVYDNPFLNALGLSFASVYNGINTNVNTSSFAAQNPFGPALFTGVNAVFADNGNDISLTAPVSGVTDQLWTSGGHGVFAAAEINSVPEPASLLLLGTGVTLLIPVVRRRRRK